MGNWRSVQIVGTCPADEVPALLAAITPNHDFSNCGPLSGGDGICGISDWPAAEINVCGNLFERDYGVDSVAEHLGKLAEAAPGLDVAIHCGGDYEDMECVATVRLKGGKVEVLPPEIATIAEASDLQLERNMYRTLWRNAAMGK